MTTTTDARGKGAARTRNWSLLWEKYGITAVLAAVWLFAAFFTPNFATADNLQNVLRWEGIATAHDETRGTQWYFGQTWYHLFEGSNAISLRAFVRGETNAPVELQEYGLHLTWRRPFTREWLYLSVGPSITWPRELEEEERDLSLGFHVWLEMEFGDWRW